MRVGTLILASILASGYNTCGPAKPDVAAPTLASSVSAPKKPAPPVSSQTSPAKLDFAAHVRPILESRCTPCHFAGGTMYQRLPFDRPETIKALGTKLFTRIKDENEQRLLREFISQLSEHDHALP